MEEIKEIRIENASHQPMRICLWEIANIIERESDFIDKTRKKGCRFYFKDAQIGIFPICPAFPEDVLAFFVTDGEKSNNDKGETK